MQTRFPVLAVAAAAALLAGAAHAEVSFDANIEHDIKKAAKQDVVSSGRVELNVKAALAQSGDNFVNAKATVEIPTGNGDDKVGIADAWIQLGNSSIDLKVGRQEAADLFPLGKDVVVDGAGTASGDDFNGGYRANRVRGRIKTGALHAVAGFNAAPGLRLELGVVTKKGDDTYGLRPTLVYSAGALTVRAGAESVRSKNAPSASGFGLSVGVAPAEGVNVNVNYAKSSKLEGRSFGINATFGAAGVGYVQDKDTALNEKVSTVYAAYSFPLMGVKGATITPAISRSTGTGVDGLTAFKVRFNYAF
jgi:hypothetical protein